MYKNIGENRGYSKIMSIGTTAVLTTGAVELDPLILPADLVISEQSVEPKNDVALDVALTRRIAGGDMDAFEELYSLYYRRVYSLCYRMTRNQSEAEDLTHDIFVHLYKKIEGFRGQSALMTWLHRVTVNQVLMHFRRKAARPREVSCDTETAVEIEALSAVKNVAGAPARVELEKAIAELPPGYRLVLVMHDVQGYEHGEIARAAGISVGTSKSQLHKARRKLRKQLLERSGE
jgi:RNA polymerase sigma-70 factor (ECF subfamily)